MKVKNLFVIIPLVLLFMLGGCTNKQSQMLGQLAYNETKNENVLYIQEEGVYVPYLIVTNNYDGKTLLLRQYALDQMQIMNEYEAAYENSSIDEYLNNDFYDRFSDQVKNLVKDTNVEILTKESLEQAASDTYIIQRNVFLLSYTELNYSDNGHVGKEGEPLIFFKNPENRLAKTETGQYETIWWLRSADSLYFSCFYAVGVDGQTGNTNAFDENSIRPAFCLDGDLSIKEMGTDGVKGYILKDLE